MRYQVLIGMEVNDLIADWSLFCRSFGMELGCPGKDSHVVTVVSENRVSHIPIAHPAGSDPEATLQMFLNDFIRRHPHAELQALDSEEALHEACSEEDHVGFMI